MKKTPTENPKKPQNHQPALQTFLARAGWKNAARRALPGDASQRRYSRLAMNNKTAILMEWPPLPPYQDAEDYSRKVGLAGNPQPFLAIARYLRSLRLHAPEILAHDESQGLLLLEDLGSEDYASALKKRNPNTLYRAAVKVLARLHQEDAPKTLPIDRQTRHRLPIFDEAILLTELSLFPEWFMADNSPSLMEDWNAIWRGILPQLDWGFSALLLRDYHTPNLIWMPHEKDLMRVGILDFQDAILGPPAYDLVSLLQDARLDVGEAREREMRDLYMARMGIDGKNGRAFLRTYAIFGAQRAARILGLFARLKARDGKPLYMRHIPRLLFYMRRNLAHESLANLRGWLRFRLAEFFGEGA